MLKTALALVLAHLITDFLLQSDWMIRHKTRPQVLVLHVLIVASLSWALLGLPPAPGLIALIAATHLVIDAAKLRWGGGGFRPFAIDQGAHLAAIAAGAALWPGVWDAGFWPQAAAQIPELARAPETMALAAGAIAAVPAGVYAVATLMTGVPTPSAGSLPKGGRLIGKLERLVILMLILAGQPDGIGFLIAAKSILRFNELTGTADRHVSEYVIIGTLASFAWAIACGYATRGALDALLQAAPS